MRKTSECESSNATEQYERLVLLHNTLKERMREGKTTTGLENQVLESVPPGIYEHWKSSDRAAKFYAVFNVSNEVDWETPPIVNYAPLYAPYAGRMPYRSLLDDKKGFLYPVKNTEYRGPRFVLLKLLDRAAVLGLIEHAAQFAKIRERAKLMQVLGI
jgi:hypothetical protein